MTETHAVSVEKKVVAAGLVVSAGHLMFIAYAAFALGIEVPTCVTNVAPFDQGSLIRNGEKHYEVHLLARMWAFEPSKITVPTGSVVDFYLTSKDVVHGFLVSGTNANLTSVPGVVNYARVRFTQPGVFPMICHEYCGAGHQEMSGVVEVRSDIDDAVVEGLPFVPSAEGLSAEAARGLHVFQSRGCVACHSLDGRRSVGPTFHGLIGREETFADGTKLEVDRDYVIESIREPQKKRVQGFEAQMPTVPLTPDEVDALVSYIETLH